MKHKELPCSDMFIVHTLYDIVIRVIDVFFSFLNTTHMVLLLSSSNKVRKFVQGQYHIFDKIQQNNSQKKIIWVHAASLGELGIARPIIRELREKYNYHVLLTFFSSTGYEATSKYLGTKVCDADEIYYLPLDTKQNASRFLQLVSPQKVIFVVSEIWPNYLKELKEHSVPTYLISAKVNANSAVMKWYGGLVKDAFRCFTHISCLDEKSKELLGRIGIKQVTVMGDPLFDNAVVIAKKAYSNHVIEKFCLQYDVFIAGSIHDKKDLELVSYVANMNSHDKFIFVPHEIYPDVLRQIKYSLKGCCKLYSECDENTDFTSVQVLVVDFLGALSSIYRFCKYAYVGGGFTPYLHSVIEATVYGLPVAFGPKINRKVVTQQLIERGVGKVVTTGKELNLWYCSLKSDSDRLEKIKERAISYTKKNEGATEKVVKMIMN